MEEIKTVDELKTLIKEKVLPAYEAAYADENSDFDKLEMDCGICRYCEKILKVNTNKLFMYAIEGLFIAPLFRNDHITKEEAILPRIEWMRKFINE